MSKLQDFLLTHIKKSKCFKNREKIFDEFIKFLLKFILAELLLLVVGFVLWMLSWFLIYSKFSTFGIFTVMGVEYLYCFFCMIFLIKKKFLFAFLFILFNFFFWINLLEKIIDIL